MVNLASKHLLYSIIFIVSSSVWTLAEAGDCKKHIELHSAKYMANEYGQSEMWVLSNVKINLWEKETSKGKGKKVGSMMPSSRALIIEEGLEDYKVKSPLDKSIGWISKIQVSKTLYQDTDTREPCKNKK